jgi:hypothetical protein
LGLYETLIHSILLNGSEARNFPKQVVNKIDLFEKNSPKDIRTYPFIRSVESQMQEELFELQKDILPSARLCSDEET